MGKYIQFLQDTDLFYGVTLQQLAWIESICQEKIFSPGELILSESAPDTDLYLVYAGKVEVLVNPDTVAPNLLDEFQPVTIAALYSGQCFGEIALVDQGMRSASIRAADPGTTVLKISRVELISLFDTHPELGYRVMYNLSVDLAQKIRNSGLRFRQAILFANKPDLNP